jgi:isoleucyl-tRNA synthetase
MSYALSASPIDYKNDILESKLREEKSKLNRESLLKQLKTVPQNMSDSTIPFSVSTVSEIHKNLKEENEQELSNFYSSELNNYAPPIKKDNQFVLLDNANIIENPKPTDEVLTKLNKMIDMFEEQREIKTSKKNEESVLYCFLGVFTIYILDSFVSIGKYSR